MGFRFQVDEPAPSVTRSVPALGDEIQVEVAAMTMVGKKRLAPTESSVDELEENSHRNSIASRLVNEMEFPEDLAVSAAFQGIATTLLPRAAAEGRNFSNFRVRSLASSRCGYL